MSIAHTDPEIQKAIEAEAKRQNQEIELIASENIVSRAVMEAQGSCLTNKYAEGYPGRRYYGGCQHVDVVEQLAIDRAKKLFDASYANVQPHSGAQANNAAFFALVNPGDTFLGMSLDQGGHLTHGSPVNFSGKHYKAVHYGLNEQGDIDYEQMRRLVQEHKPSMVIGGFSAFSGIVDWGKMRSIADSVDAWFLVDMAHIAGLVAAGLYPSPLPHAHVVTTTTHKTLRGPRGGLILSAVDDANLHKKLNSAVFPGTQGGPLMHVIAAKAVCFQEAMQPGFNDYQKRVLENVSAMCETFGKREVRIVSGGSKNHLLLLDLTDKDLSGKDAEAALGKAHITVNKNTIPNDPRSPFVTSGLRLGTAAITSRGMQQKQAEQIANWIADILYDWENQTLLQDIRTQAISLCERFPIDT